MLERATIVTLNSTETTRPSCRVLRELFMKVFFHFLKPVLDTPAIGISC